MNNLALAFGGYAHPHNPSQQAVVPRGACVTHLKKMAIQFPNMKKYLLYISECYFKCYVTY